MKAFIKYTLLVLLPLGSMLGSLTSCGDDEAVGEPAIHYVRVTKPSASDSLLESAFLGNLIAIVGENLGGAKEIWFNDQKAVLNPTYITNRSILVTIPNLPPTEVSNQMVLKFGNGTELRHDFVIDIPAPIISDMQSEYVADGDVAIIRGDFFYEPLTVSFAGGVEAELVSVKQNEIQVIVPEGAAPGAITVKTNFGTAVSRLHFRDNRHVFANIETTTSGWWHGPAFIVENDPDIDPVDGRFIRINRSLGKGEWFEFLVAPADSDIKLGTRNIPDEAIKNPSAYNLKFEIATMSPFIAGTKVWMYIGNNMASERNDKGFTWSPVLDTKGQWQTVTIPFEQVIAKVPVKVDPNGYGVSFWFWQGAEMPLNFAIDNLRVSPK